MSIKNYYTGRKADSSYLYDLSGSTDGSLDGNPAPAVNSNGYLSFTGQNGNSASADRNRVDFPISDFEYNSGDVFTFTLMFRLPDTWLSNDARLMFIGRKNLNGYMYIGHDRTLYGTKINIYMRDTNGNVLSINSSASVGDGAWHIAHLVYDGSGGAVLYIDGEVDSSQSASLSGNFYNTFGSALLGCERSGIGDTDYKYDLSGGIALFINRNEALPPAAVKNEYMFIKGFI